MALKQDPKPEEYSSGTSSQVSPNQSGNIPSSALPIPAVVQLPQTPDPNRETAEKPGWRKNVTLVIEVLGLAAIIVYTIFSILQWAQIRYTNQLTARALDGSEHTLTETLNKMQLQIDAANGANQLTRQSVEGNQSAILEVSPGISMESYKLFTQEGASIGFGNDGKVFASNVIAKVTFTRVSIPEFQKIGQPKVANLAKSQIAPHEPGFSTETVLFRQFGLEDISESEWQKIRSTKETFQFNVSYSFDNGLGRGSATINVCFLRIS